MTPTPRQQQIESAVRDFDATKGRDWPARQRAGWLAGALARITSVPVRVRVTIEVDTDNLGVVPLGDFEIDPVMPGERVEWRYPASGLEVREDGIQRVQRSVG